MLLLGFITVAATVFSGVVTAGMLFALRKAIEVHDPRLGAQMFEHSFLIWGIIPYLVLGIRSITGWFQRQGATPITIEQAQLARYPFIATLTLGTLSYLLLAYPQ